MALRLLHDRAAPGADGTARPVRGVADLGGAMAAITIAAACAVIDLRAATA